MEFRTINVVTTDLTISLDFTGLIQTLFELNDLKVGLIWSNGGNCRYVTVDQIVGLIRDYHIGKEVAENMEIKKGPPPQYRIYWDDCPEVPANLSDLLK